MVDNAFSGRSASVVGPASTLVPVVPSDDVDLTAGLSRGLFVAGAGTMVVQDLQGVVVALGSGDNQYHPIRVRRVMATDTTATGIVALY